MSLKNRIDLKQDRREWLRASATMLGAVAFPLRGLPAEDSGTEPQGGKTDTGVAPAEIKRARFFTPTQRALVEELSETIIPADAHSGGAKAAKVPDFIEQVVRESVDEKQQALWHEGLRLIELMSQHYTGRSFLDASAEERISVLQVLSDNVHLTELPEVAFFVELKELTVRGYYTSKIGIHDELDYKGNRILMEFVGCDDPTPPAS
jgi:gluconate 2-dehydrogenase gamma chain